MPDPLRLTTPQVDSTQTRHSSDGPETSSFYRNANVVSQRFSSADNAVLSWRANQRTALDGTWGSLGMGTGQASPATLPTHQPESRTERILGIRKWVGSITSVEDGILTAELFPFDHDGPSLVADFELSLLSPDESLALPGGVVYLTTRTIESDWGQKTATSQLRLRRPWHWSKRDLDEILTQARKRAHTLQAHARRCAQ
jgi:hypothetical protein